MEATLSLEQFKKLALQYQRVKKKANLDYTIYTMERSFRIKRRCKYLKGAKVNINYLINE